MTISERYREANPPTYADFWKWVAFVATIDSTAALRKDDLGPYVLFSDDSIHRLDKHGLDPHSPIYKVLK